MKNKTTYILIFITVFLSCNNVEEKKTKLNEQYTAAKIDSIFLHLSNFKNINTTDKSIKEIKKHKSPYITEVDSNEICKLNEENTFRIKYSNIDTISDYPYALKTLYNRFLEGKWDTLIFENTDYNNLIYQINDTKKYKYVYTSYQLYRKGGWMNSDGYSFESGKIIGKIYAINILENTIIFEAYVTAYNSHEISFFSESYTEPSILDKFEQIGEDLESNFNSLSKKALFNYCNSVKNIE